MIAWLLQEAQRPLRVDRPAPGDTMTVFHPPPGTSVTERIIRWFFSVPQWVQIFGLVVALGLAIVSVYMIVKNRHELMSWIRRRH